MSIFKALLYTLLIIIIWLTLQVSIHLLFKYLVGRPDDFTHFYGVAKIISAIGTFFIIYKFFWKPKFDLEKALKCSNHDGSVYLYLLVIAIGLFLIDRPFWDIDKIILHYQDISRGETIVIEKNFTKLFYDLLSILLIAPIVEELLFRKFLLGKLIEKNKTFISILISSLCFSLIHIETPNNLIPTFIGGILLGLIYLKTKQIGYSIVLHFLFNLIVVLSNNLNFSETNWLLGYNFDAVYWLLSGLGVVIILVVFY